MSVEEFYDITPRQLQNKARGHREARELDFQLAWEVARWQAAVNIAPHTKNKIKPKDLANFPWDGKKKVYKAATFEEVQEAVKKVFG